MKFLESSSSSDQVRSHGERVGLRLSGLEPLEEMDRELLGKPTNRTRRDEALMIFHIQDLSVKHFPRECCRENWKNARRFMEHLFSDHEGLKGPAGVDLEAESWYDRGMNQCEAPDEHQTRPRGTIWVVISLEQGAPHEIEFFSTRPNTPDIGGEPDNWPPHYLVYEGNIDGGDSVLLGRGND